MDRWDFYLTIPEYKDRSLVHSCDYYENAHSVIPEHMARIEAFRGANFASQQMGSVISDQSFPDTYYAS